MVVADKREADVHSIAPGASIPDDAPPTDPDPMSQGQLPPATDGLYYDFNNMDATSVQDMANNQLPMDGIDGLDMMNIFNNPLFASGVNPFTQQMDSMAGSSLVSPFSQPLASPLSQGTMGPLMAPAVRSTPLVAPQPAAPSIPQEPPTQDGLGNQHNPAQSGTSGGASGSSTDFTKRRNWPAKVIEMMKDLLQVLDNHGRIKYVSPSVTALAGYQQTEVANLYLKDFIHPDDVGLFVSEMNGTMASGEPMRMFYRFKAKGGTYSIFEGVGHAHAAPPHLAPNPTAGPICQAFFLISRPYPTRNAGLLDTFLEHKVENERLRRRIANLRLEEETEEADAQRQLKQRRGSKSEASRPDDLRTPGSSAASAMVDGAMPPPGSAGGMMVDGVMPPPERRASSSGELTRENLEGAAGSRSDSLRDKMARYERGSRADTIEMLTGLRYVDGERGRGTASGRSSPKLITGDAGITIPVGRESRAGEKKRKQKVVEEYVCTDCGTLESPEWRKGPNGPKTLCNACGLRWAKKEKKRQLVNLGTVPSTTSGGDRTMAG